MMYIESTLTTHRIDRKVEQDTMSRRARNWTLEEQEMLLSLVEKNADVILAPLSGKVSVSLQDKTWDGISLNVSSLGYRCGSGI